MPNSFDIVNRVRCFNHTTQLSAKALLRPFNGTEDEDDANGEEVDPGEAEAEVTDLYDDNDDDDEEEVEDDGEADDDDDDDEDPFQDLDDDERLALLENTSTVRETLNKVCLFAFIYFLSDTHYVLIDSQIIVCHCSVNYHCTSGLARHLYFPPTSHAAHPS